MLQDTSFNYQTAPGHQVLAAAGKTVLRPGGRQATEQLSQWAGFQPGETVLEVAASFGENAIALTQRFGVRVVGIEKNPDSVARARENIRRAGLKQQITIMEADIFHLDAIPNQFDYVLAEAILTMQSMPGKTKVLQAIRAHLKPGGKFLSHELMALDHAEAIHQRLSEVLRVNATPLSITSWTEAFQQANLTVQQKQTGQLGLLNPLIVLQDEGLGKAARFYWNVLTHAPIRNRVQQMRQAFNQYQQDIGYAIFCAS